MTPEPGQGGGESNFDNGEPSGGSRDTITPEPGNSNDGSAFDGPPERSDRDTFEESVETPDPTGSLTPDQRQQFRQDLAEDSQFDSDEIVITNAERTQDGLELAFEPTTETRKEAALRTATEEYDERTLLTDISSDDVVFDGQEAELSAEAKARVARNRAAASSNDLDPEDIGVTFDSSGGIADVSLEREVSSRDTSGTGTGSQTEPEGVQDRTLEDVRESAADDLGVDPSAVELERVDDGFVARAEQEQQEDDFTVFDRGDDWPTNFDEASGTGLDLLTGDGAELFKTDVPTNRREVSQAIISARRERLGLDIDPIDPGDAADSAVDRVTNFGGEEGALVAAGIGVVTPEPSTTAVGGAILIGAAGAAVLSSGSELDVGQPNQDVSEVEAGEPGERTVSEVEVTDPDVTELEVGEFAPEASEIQVGDPTSTDGEVDVPSVETSTTVGSTQPGQITEEDIPGGIGNPTDSPSVPDPLEEDTSDDTVPDVERDFPTGGDAVVNDSVGTDVGEDVGEPEVEAGFELDHPTEGTETSVGTGGLGDAGVGVGPGAWFGPRERSGATEATDVAADISAGNAPATAPMVDVYSASPAQAFETPYPQAFGNNQWTGNAYATSTTQASRTRQGRGTPRPPFPGFESSPNQPEPPGASPINIQITNPVATATDVLGVGSGMEMADSSPDAMPAEDDFEDEWPSGAGFGGFGGWSGGSGEFGGFDGAGFGGASFDDGGDMWDPDNWENDQGGQGGLFGGF